jgi:hypothetical protein
MPTVEEVQMGRVDLEYARNDLGFAEVSGRIDVGSACGFLKYAK